MAKKSISEVTEGLIPEVRTSLSSDEQLRALYQQNLQFEAIIHDHEGKFATKARTISEYTSAGLKILEGAAEGITLGAAVPFIEAANLIFFFITSYKDVKEHGEALKEAGLSIKARDYVVAAVKSLNPFGVVPRNLLNFAGNLLTIYSDSRVLHGVQSAFEGGLVSPIEQAMNRHRAHLNRGIHRGTRKHAEKDPDFRKLERAEQRIVLESLRQKGAEILGVKEEAHKNS